MAEVLRTAGFLRATVAILFAACTISALAWRSRTTDRNRLVLRIVLLASLSPAVLFMEGLPEERLHFLIYGLLGWLICWSLEHEKIVHLGTVKGWLFPCLLVWLAGAIDECIQWWLPSRVFDVRDILFNGGAGMLGITLFATGSRQGTQALKPFA